MCHSGMRKLGEVAAPLPHHLLGLWVLSVVVSLSISSAIIRGLAAISLSPPISKICGSFLITALIITGRCCVFLVS